MTLRATTKRQSLHRARIRAGAVAGLLDDIAAQGGSVERVLARADLQARDLSELDHFVDLEKVLHLVDTAAREVGDESFALRMSLDYDPGSLGAISYAVLNAPTVETALHNLERYAHTFALGARVALEPHAAEPTLVFDLLVGNRQLGRQAAEGAAGILLVVLRRLLGPSWRPRRVFFGHTRPADTSELERVFGPVLQFGAPVTTGLVLDRSDLAQPVPGADRRLLPIVEQHLDELASGLDDRQIWLRDLRGRIEHSICDGQPSLEKTARSLGLGTRTLQRRLAELGLAWKKLVEDVRRELALRYLAETRASLTEVAFLLGYSELSAFDRAFRRWTGETPVAHRRRLAPR